MPVEPERVEITPPRERGLFIVFEGPAGAGKTTLIDRLCEELELEKIFSDRGNELKPKVEEEDGATLSISEHIKRGHAFLDQMEKANYHMEPLLLQQKDCVADRWFYSTQFYQGSAIKEWHDRNGLGPRRRLILEKRMDDLRKPDILFLLYTKHAMACMRKKIEFQKERYDYFLKKYTNELPIWAQESGIDAFFEIDTTSKSKKQVLAFCIEKIQKIKNGE